MLSFLRKFAQSLVTLLGVTLVIFLLLFWVPRFAPRQLPPDDKAQTAGKAAPAIDPTDAMALTFAGDHTDKATLERIKTSLGLNQPLPLQYVHFLQKIATNDLRSYRNGDVVFTAIARRFPATLLLAIAALCVYLLIAVPVSLVTANNGGKALDRVVLLFSIFAISIPTFWLGRIFQHYLGYEAHLFSVGGGASLWNLPLPALTLGVGGSAFYARLLHTNLRGVLKQDYIRAARARGLSENKVLSKHALKNALIPVVAVLGAEFASLLSGLIFTEKIFGWPGIGSLAVDSVFNKDTPMIMGTVLFAALMVVIGNLVVDVVYRVIDPRVRV